MRILSVIGKNFYGRSDSIEPMYFEFTAPLRDLGHELEHFDHHSVRRSFGLEECGKQFVKRVRQKGFDLVFYQTAGQDWMPRECIQDAGKYSAIVAWNSDDDWQWETYTRHLAPYFTFMVTTYPHIFEANRRGYPNLRLSQWGCYEGFEGFGREKDLNFTFVGQIYGYRNAHCRYLKQYAGLEVFGIGARLVKLGLPTFRGCSRIPVLSGKAVSGYSEVSSIWNSSRISYTPLGASVDPKILQIKGRVFQMGLSGTMMLCDNHPDLSLYFEPGKEFIPFESLEDCAEKARYYSEHESERARIAKAYYERTKAEHLWRHRFQQLFRNIGLN